MPRWSDPGPDVEVPEAYREAASVLWDRCDRLADDRMSKADARRMVSDVFARVAVEGVDSKAGDIMVMNLRSLLYDVGVESAEVSVWCRQRPAATAAT